MVLFRGVQKERGWDFPWPQTSNPQKHDRDDCEYLYVCGGGTKNLPRGPQNCSCGPACIQIKILAEVNSF